ncbi:RimK/LysX family protein [Marinobacteraceae bacterium S3BR75-40.1]
MRTMKFGAWVFGLLLAFAAVADSTTPGKVISGWVEKISFEKVDGVIKAKMDTGANTSSIYADSVERFEKDDEEWVRFEVVLEDVDDEEHRVEMERPVARNVRIKNHDGNHDRRAVVELDFCFDGRRREAEFTLADRSEYIYPVLLGRNFINGVAVIDVEHTFLTQARCEE